MSSELNKERNRLNRLIREKKEEIKEQVELLNNHIPKIMDLGSSSFDKVSKTKYPIEQLKEIIKAGNND